jgi:hypothetical protein
MKELNMTRLLLAMVLAGAAAAPAFPMADTMTCQDFTMLDAAGQAEAMQPEGGMMSGDQGAGGMMAADAMMAPADMAAAAAEACAAHPDMTVGEAMQATR